MLRKFFANYFEKGTNAILYIVSQFFYPLWLSNIQKRTGKKIFNYYCILFFVTTLLSNLIYCTNHITIFIFKSLLKMIPLHHKHDFFFHNIEKNWWIDWIDFLHETQPRFYSKYYPKLEEIKYSCTSQNWSFSCINWSMGFIYTASTIFYK